jgi:hypothetical protein
LRQSDKKRLPKPKPSQYSALDSHVWKTKMEIVRLISGKPDLKPKTLPKPAS